MLEKGCLRSQKGAKMVASKMMERMTESEREREREGEREREIGRNTDSC